MKVYFYIFVKVKRITIKKPEEVKRQILEYFQGSEDLKFAFKLQGILLLLNNEDTNCSAISRIYGSTPHTIASWVRKLNEGTGGNIEVLKNKPKPGRATQLSKNDMAIIKDVLKKKPSHYNLPSPNWDGDTLSVLLEKQFGIKLQVRQCQRILQRLGRANKRGRPWNKRPV